ncbi:MAG: tyrosine-type recombinase/integrase [Myxococcota bacterium]
MAWIKTLKRKNPATGQKEKYLVIAWRDHTGRMRERALGYIGMREANRRLKVFEGLLATGNLIEPDDAVDVPQRSPPSSTRRTTPAEPHPPPPPEPRRSSRKLGEYLENTYLPRADRKYEASTMVGFRERARTLTKALGNVRLDELDYAMLDDYVLVRTEHVRTRTVQLELAFLRLALQHAVLREELAQLPRFPRVKLTDAKPHRFLTNDETQALLAALDPARPQPHEVTRGSPPLQRDRYAWLAVLTALNTGMRKSEILSRKWDDIRWRDGPLGSILVGDQPDIGFKPKTRKSRVIPLTPELREALWSARSWSSSPWVFPRRADPSLPRTSFAKALSNACVRVGIEPIHIHGLRHSWASRLARSGVDRRTLMEVGGWASSQMLDEVYSHVSDDHKADVMSRMGIDAGIDDEDEDEVEDGEE